MKHLPKDLKHIDWLSSLVEFLLILGHFNWSDDTSVGPLKNMEPLSTEDKQLCHLKVTNLMTDLIRMSRPGKGN